MKKFEIGKEYFDHSICNYDCVFTIKIVKRTEKTVTFERNGKTRRAKLFSDERGEYIIPDRYSMAPVFRAECEVQPEEEPAAEESTPAPTEDAARSISFVCGACYPVQAGTVIGFESSPATRFFPSCVYAVIRWVDRPAVPERVRLSDIHRRGWRSANGSPLGVFVTG